MVYHLKWLPYAPGRDQVERKVVQCSDILLGMSVFGKMSEVSALREVLAQSCGASVGQCVHTGGGAEYIEIIRLEVSPSPLSCRTSV